VTTNIAFLRRIMEHPAFIAGDMHTRFLDEHSIAASPGEPPVAALLAAALGSLQPQQSGAAQANRESPMQRGDLESPWQTAGAWRAV
jgi:acetyl/propionyl-CoA carboxylase alpha subunit